MYSNYVRNNCAGALFLLVALPAFTGYDPVFGEVVSVIEDLNAPRFVEGQKTDVYVGVGETARLACAVKRVQDKSVLWVRFRDLHILTFDHTVFTADPRVSLKMDNSSFVLNIKKAQVSDTGRYECQINTEPKMSMFFNLTVIDQPLPKLKVWISGPPEQRAPPGHTITFTCEAKYVWKNQQPAFNIPLAQINLYWLFEQRPIASQTDHRGGILVDTDRTSGSATSRLTISDVTSRDQGQYTCVVGQQRDSLSFLLEHEYDEYGERMEAMQRDQANRGAEKAAKISSTTILSVLLILFYLRTLNT